MHIFNPRNRITVPNKKPAEGRIEQEICAYECASGGEDIEWAKEVANEFGLGSEFADRAAECARCSSLLLG